MLSEHAIEQVLRGAPQLEILILRFAISTANLNVESNSLKRLKIERNLNPNEDGRFFWATVGISTPYLETLEISGIHHNNYVLRDVSSLTSAIVGFIDPFSHYIISYELFKVLQGILEHVIANIHHLEKVTGWSVQVLRKMKKETVAPLSNVKFLSMYATDVGNMSDLLGIFPNLRMLVLSQDLGTHTDQHFLEIGCLSAETRFSEFDIIHMTKADVLLPYLRTVEITWTVVDCSIFQFIEMLSANVRKLETVVLRVGGAESCVPVESQLFASETLVRVQKAFPAADVIVRQD